MFFQFIIVNKISIISITEQIIHSSNLNNKREDKRSPNYSVSNAKLQC